MEEQVSLHYLDSLLVSLIVILSSEHCQYYLSLLGKFQRVLVV